MTASWFSITFPPSRFAIESELRSIFWRAGYGNLWFTCVRDEPPFECLGLWQQQEFRIEWQPLNYLLLKTQQPNQALLAMFERIMGHKALAAYKDDAGQVIVEWRAKGGAARLEELKSSQVMDLEPLYR